MAEEAEIAITILPDEVANLEGAEKQEAVATPAPPEEDPAKADLKSQFAELEKRAESERTARLAAERDAAKHRQDAEDSRKRESSANLDTITTAINAATQEIESAKTAYVSAREAGDYRAEVEANDRLATARAEILRLDEAKQGIESKVKTPIRREREQPIDPVEAFAAGRTEPTAKWVRAHPEYVRSEKGMKKLSAADAVAQDEGFLPDTPEYFSRVEQYLGIGKAAAVDRPAAKEAPTEAAQVPVPSAKPRSAAPPVAPGAAVSSNGASHSDKAVTLTKREADAAQDGTHVWNYNDPKGKFKKGDAIGLQEMARRKLALQRAGAYDRSFSDG